MIKVEKQVQTIAPDHAHVVFASKEDADKKDMSTAIGRFDNKRKAIALLDGTVLGKKYKALLDGGFQLYLAPDDRNNYFVASVSDVIAQQPVQSYDKFSNVLESEQEQEQETKSELKFVGEQEFLKNHIDSAMDLDFTTPQLKYEHRVGLYNETDNVYTLRNDVVDLLNEFTFDVNETEEGVLARVNPESLSGRSLLMLNRLLNKQEQEDAEELQEALAYERVQFDALPIVSSLLNNINLAQKHGDKEASAEAVTELRELIKQYKQANPPASGVDKVETKLNDIIAPKKLNISEMLEQQGIKVHGQQERMNYAY